MIFFFPDWSKNPPSSFRVNAAIVERNEDEDDDDDNNDDNYNSTNNHNYNNNYNKNYNNSNKNNYNYDNENTNNHNNNDNEGCDQVGKSEKKYNQISNEEDEEYRNRYQSQNRRFSAPQEAGRRKVSMKPRKSYPPYEEHSGDVDDDNNDEQQNDPKPSKSRSRKISFIGRSSSSKNKNTSKR